MESRGHFLRFGYWRHL